MDSQQSQDVLDRLPEAHEVRLRLADRMQDVRMLKQLLKLCEERHRQPAEQGDVES